MFIVCAKSAKGPDLESYLLTGKRFVNSSTSAKLPQGRKVNIVAEGKSLSTKKVFNALADVADASWCRFQEANSSLKASAARDGRSEKKQASPQKAPKAAPKSKKKSMVEISDHESDSPDVDAPKTDTETRLTLLSSPAASKTSSQRTVPESNDRTMTLLREESCKSSQSQQGKSSVGSDTEDIACSQPSSAVKKKPSPNKGSSDDDREELEERKKGKKSKKSKKSKKRTLPLRPDQDPFSSSSSSSGSDSDEPPKKKRAPAKKSPKKGFNKALEGRVVRIKLNSLMRTVSKCHT
jgi:hypothetical protein